MVLPQAEQLVGLLLVARQVVLLVVYLWVGHLVFQFRFQLPQDPKGKYHRHHLGHILPKQYHIQVCHRRQNRPFEPQIICRQPPNRSNLQNYPTPQHRHL